ncbi:MAG: hypothetical protein WCK86_05685 [Planctomycetia bacterium]
MAFLAPCRFTFQGRLVSFSLLSLIAATGCQSLHLPPSQQSHVAAKVITTDQPGVVQPPEIPVFDAPTEMTSSDATTNFTPPPASLISTEKVAETESGIPNDVVVQSETEPSSETTSQTQPEPSDAEESLTPISKTSLPDSPVVVTEPASTPGSPGAVPSVESAADTAAALVQPDSLAEADDNPANVSRVVAQVDPVTRKDISGAGTTPAPSHADPQNALKKPLQFAMTPPGNMTWESTGKTAGGRNFQIVTTGDEGFHTLIVGSAVGNDPVAIQLADRLARHLHENSLIFGGFQTTILRTLNPDGEAILKSVNGHGNYVNRGFPTIASATSTTSTPESVFLLKLITDLKPSRVVHLRTVPGTAGAVGASRNCEGLSEQIAESQKLRQFTFPENINEGTLEFYLSSFTKTEVMTLAIPAEITSDVAWDLYQDTLLNMIQPNPVKTQRGQQRSAADLSEN